MTMTKGGAGKRRSPDGGTAPSGADGGTTPSAPSGAAGAAGAAGGTVAGTTAAAPERLSHVPGEGTAHAAAVERAVDLACHLQGGSNNRDGAFADGGFRAHPLGGSESALQYAVQLAADHSGLERHAISLAHLAEHLRIADDAAF